MSIDTISQASTPPPFDIASYLDLSSQAIVSPAGQEGISGFVFDIPKEESIDLQSDITEHYVESGSFINDHVVQKPVQITLTGLIGELVFRGPKPGTLSAQLAGIQNKLSAVSGYLAPLAPQAAQTASKIISGAQYAANQLSAIAQQAKNLVSYFNGDSLASTLQQDAFRKLNAMWKGKQVLTVQTPWSFYEQMMIESMAVRQEEGSTEVSDFSIMLKEVRFTDVLISTFDDNLFPPANSIQGSDATKYGPMNGWAVPENQSFLYYLVYGTPPSGLLANMFGWAGG